MRKVNIGAPGFILMEDMRQDMPGTLRKIAKLGYDGIELLGFFGHSASDIRLWCAQSGLTPYSCFVSLAELCGMPTDASNPVDAAVAMPGQTAREKFEYIRAIGCEYMSFLLPDEPMDETVTARINQITRMAGDFGIKAQYHNHAAEYANRWGDGYRMDFIMANTDERLLFEPDLGWMEIGGSRCPDQLRRYASRVEIVHLKDYYRQAFDTALPHEFRPTGYGVMDWGRLIPLCEKEIRPRWYTLDHDKARPGQIYAELGMSLDFVRNALLFCDEGEP